MLSLSGAHVYDLCSGLFLDAWIWHAHVLSFVFIPFVDCVESSSFSSV